MKLLAVMLKDLRLISRDYPGLIALLLVPIVVITVIASATQSGPTTKSIIFPVVDRMVSPLSLQQYGFFVMAMQGVPDELLSLIKSLADYDFSYWRRR